MRDPETWIRRTFELAVRGLSGASPNPLVGCVIVKNERLVAEGYHAGFGGPHAEINALEKAGPSAKGATLYTNLEPCCHWGKTPPCTEAILRSGITTVISAMSDPNPLVRGKGFQELRSAGLQVRRGVLEADARDLNRAFIKFITRKRPYVLLKSALSLDGKIATAGGDSRWITAPLAREFSRHLRTQVDGILVGAGTVRKDDPSLTSHGYGRDPVRIVLSSGGKIPKNARVLDGRARTLLFHCNRRLKPGRNGEWIYMEPLKDGKIGFTGILDVLAEKGISKLLVEGGGETAAAALQSGETDEILYFLAPILIGGRDARTAFEGSGSRNISNALRLERMTVESLGPDWMVRARVRNG